MQQNHWLVIGENKDKQQLQLDRATYSIGRDSTCDICLKSHFVSLHHATLVRELNPDGSSYYTIVDGSPQGEPSANGVLVNKQKLRSKVLQDKDEINLGPQVYAHYYTASPNFPDGEEGAAYPKNPFPPSPNTNVEAFPDAGQSLVP